MAKTSPAIDTIKCNGSQGSKMIGVTIQWFNKLVREKWIKASGKNQYLLVDIVHGYKAYLLDESRQAQKSKSASRVQDARATQIELQTMKELGKLVPAEDVIAWNAEILGTLRTELIGVPAASTRDLEVRAEIEKQVNAAVDRAKRSFEAQSDALRRGEQGPPDPEDPDA